VDGVAFYHLILGRKKQETFFRFPAWCAAVWAAGI